MLTDLVSEQREQNAFEDEMLVIHVNVHWTEAIRGLTGLDRRKRQIRRSVKVTRQVRKIGRAPLTVKR